LPPFLALSIAYVAFRPENAALLREGGAFAAASCCSLTTLLAVCTGPGTATVPNLFLVSLAVVVAVFFAPLRFAAAAALVTLTALALWLALLMWVDAPASLRFYPLDFLLAVSAPALFAVHRLERSARDAYLNAMLQDLRIEQLAFENSLLSQLSATDALTGAANRRHLEHTLHMLCTEPPCGDFLLLADIDFFKRFNDSHGHIAGDACLREVVAAMRSQVRRSDLVARFGGEEFAIILPRTTYADALAMAERIRAGVAGHCMRVAGRMEQVTVSIGVAERGRAMAPSTLLALADDALYAAKREGRNRVHCAMQPALDLIKGKPLTSIS
jgi:diguanylate cyclase (GGDEF)-like protein